MPDSPHLTAPATDAELLQSAFRYALSLSHHAEDAEDLVQQAWLNLCRTYGRVESRGALFTAVRHLFVDQCRRHKVVQFESLDGLGADDAPFEPVGEPGVQGDLAGLLAVLGPMERETLFLHYHQGHTAEEIGRLTDRPRGSVLSTMHRAIRKLRAAAATSRSLVKVGNHILAFFVTFL